MVKLPATRSYAITRRTFQAGSIVVGHDAHFAQDAQRGIEVIQQRAENRKCYEIAITPAPDTA
jgi:hypothetical protein